MKPWERIQKIMDEEGLNKNSFSKAIGISNNVTITRIINEKRSPSRSTCEKIVSAFPKYNLAWMLTDITSYDEASPIDEPIILRVPLVSQYAQAGYLCGYADAAYMATLPTIPYIVDHEAQGHYVAFEVKGDSMNDGTEDAILEGDRLLCRMAADFVQNEFHDCNALQNKIVLFLRFQYKCRFYKCQFML